MRHPLAFTILIAGTLALPAAGFAQEQPPAPPADPGTGGDTAAAPTPRYDALSPGNKMIARSLFDAQGPAPSDGGTNGNHWTLERISDTRAAGQGWGQVFRQMKAEGAITAKNLGQVVSQYRAVPPPRPLSGGPQPVMITNAMGETNAASGTGRGAGKLAHANRGGARVHAEADGTTAVTGGGNANVAAGTRAAQPGASGGGHGRALGRGK